MQLRRALLLFGIVLGLAAVATALSGPAEQGADNASEPPRAERGRPTANPRHPPQRPALVSFSTPAKPRTKRLAANRAATVEVEVPKPGRVDLAGLGLTAAADPLTPARFDVLERRAGRHEVRFSPAAGGEARTVGTLEIVPAGPAPRR